ncbi:hypothetical protein ACW9HR_29355 [Nocardia gipuzkoensis]
MQGGTERIEKTVQGSATGVDDNGDHGNTSSSKHNPVELADTRHIGGQRAAVTEFDNMEMQDTFADSCDAWHIYVRI